MHILWLLYLIDVLPGEYSGIIPFFLIALGGIGSLISFCMLKSTSEITKDSSAYEIEEARIANSLGRPLNRLSNIVLILGLVIGILFSLVPSKQTMYLMAGTYMVNQTDIPQKLALIINNKIDLELRDLNKQLKQGNN